MKHSILITALLFSCCLLGQDWKGNYAEALLASKQESKPLVLVFSGSDWCGPCKRLDRNIWQSEAFKAYASQHYILYNADFPRKKTNKLPEEKINANKQLAERYNPKGHFPLVLVLNGQEEVLGKTGYEKVSPDAYLSLLNSFIK
ncbi:thioredoxin family protein [Flavobacteriaceae bacterium 3-367]|uniref:thioredoxin family protein n=1 Tax=Eudoraea algarum TaxID=3417568 RepID=UPI00328113BB